ncbi:cullin-2 [Drosophila sechellia]|uniref:Cullin-2 n=1 Tax=Drosophila sechellia TaxID=7238 RepID=B4IIG2_DROSE|nr:cullin-2 [Drosophila sechellia]XP_032583452.1 cullin-2 [Drosophila sechellia]EDW49712.1 GM16141 [Drosophila sechellia]
MSLKPKIVEFVDVWPRLRCIAESVITLTKVERSVWNTSFSDVYTLCVAQPEPMADRLYGETKHFLEQHVQEMLAKKVLIEGECCHSNGGPDLLQRYYTTWMEYSQGIKYLHQLYIYLNQQHIKKQKITDTESFYGNLSSNAAEQMEIGELGLDIWRLYMIEYLSSELVRHILEGIAADRASNGTLDHHRVQIINGVIHSFVEVQDYKKTGSLKLYQELFEGPMLEASGAYYTDEANKLLHRCSVSEYMQEVIRILEYESRRAQKFLHVSSLPKLRKECEEKFINDRLGFIYSECREMVSEERRQDLRNMYVVLKPIPDNLKSELITTFLDHIKSEGLQTVSALKGENIHIAFVENMLKVHHKYQELIADVFENDSLFLSALDKACASVINRRPTERQPCRSAEYVAKYCDTLLKKSKTCEAEIDQKLTNNITIFKYIEDKDVYQKFYSRLLAKRLIHEQSQSMDAEEGMINRLKQACGYEFTNKLHRMFTDISVSTDLNNKFNTHLKDSNVDLGINLAIKVLQAGAWPLGSTQVIPFAVPQEFEKSIKMFEDYYHKLFSGRKLTWLHHMCHGELKLSHLKKSYIVTMQTYQMAIILLFETCDSLSCREIQNTLQLNDETFQKHMQPIIESKLLNASSENLAGETRIELNLDYTNKRTKFKISSALQKETPQEVEHTINSVDEDRKLFLQAAIVRIMKARKVLKHNALIQEVLSLSKVSFTPNIAMIKKCVESLIDKQYIERTANSGDEYSYMA